MKDINLDDLLNFEKLHKQLSESDKKLVLGIMIGLTQKMMSSTQKC